VRLWNNTPRCRILEIGGVLLLINVIVNITEFIFQLSESSKQSLKEISDHNIKTRRLFLDTALEHMITAKTFLETCQAQLNDVLNNHEANIIDFYYMFTSYL